MLKINNPKIKGALGVAGKITLVLTAVAAFADVFVSDSQAKKIDVLWNEHESKKNS